MTEINRKKKILQDCLLERMRAAVRQARGRDKEALRELLEIAEQNIDKLTEDDIFRLMGNFSSGESVQHTDALFMD